MGKIIRLNEAQLRKLIAEKVRSFVSDKPQYDINGKKWKRNFDRMDRESNYWPTMSPEDYEEAEKATREFLNTPNAARNFEKFPRQSVKRDHDYDSLSNGKLHKSRVAALQQKREDEKEREEILRHEREIAFKVQQLTNMRKTDIANCITYIFTNGDVESAPRIIKYKINGPSRYGEESDLEYFPDYDFDDREPYVSVEFWGKWNSPEEAESYKSPYGFENWIETDEDNETKFEGEMEINYEILKDVRETTQRMAQADWDEDERIYGHD